MLMNNKTNIEILQQFLNFSLTNSQEIHDLFATLPGAIVGRGHKPLERFVYVPGVKKNNLVLVAHTDTVWDDQYGHPNQTSAVMENGTFLSTNPDCGIGADDRAGCAMLWALRNCGHSLLIVDGEEKGKHGAHYLRKHHKKLFRQLNRHRFMLELDWQGTNSCLYNQVDNTQVFKDYIASRLGFYDSQKKGGCDLQVLCSKVCGVNLGVGYHDNHRPSETLVVAEWENTYNALAAFLQMDHPKFPIPVNKRFKSFLRRCKGKSGSILRKLKLKK